MDPDRTGVVTFEVNIESENSSVEEKEEESKVFITCKVQVLQYILSCQSLSIRGNDIQR